MLPILTPAEMRAVDAAAPEPIDVLIARAGHAVAAAARDLLGGTYGRRVLVIAGKGNNGADGRAAATVLRRWGARVTVIGVGDPPPKTTHHLVIDAAVGTRLTRDYLAPDIGDVPILAVDLPSGVDGLTGQLRGRPLVATETVVLVGYKPGNLIGPGRQLSGRLRLVDIGIDIQLAPPDRSRWALVEDTDVRTRWPRRRADHHKWKAAVVVVGGSPGMAGAIGLAANGAFRAGASHVLVAQPDMSLDGSVSPHVPAEAVRLTLGRSWVESLRPYLDRVGALVIGPGLEPSESSGQQLRQLVESFAGPVLLDAGALTALGTRPTWLGKRQATGLPPVVLTPHDGEFVRLVGATAVVTADDRGRLAATCDLAASCGAVVLRKGPSTIVAGPDGEVMVAARGDARLATAGSGDVLAGVIGAGLAGGLEPLEASGLGAHLHGWAGAELEHTGLVAGDVAAQVAAVRTSWGPPW